MSLISQNEETNRVVELFSGKTILVTGGTGFLGKILIEKLLRSCPKIRKVYVFVRAKYNKSVDERLTEILGIPLFDVVRTRSGIFQKILPISGDLSLPDLGLSQTDRKILTEEVEFIYHSGGIVKFDEPFRSAVLTNVRGTKLMLALAKECRNLKAFCHVSTAYCHENENILYEKFYERPAEPNRIIELCEWIDEDDLNFLAKKWRTYSANNYTFSKALAEALIEDHFNKLPIIMVRPSVVLPIWLDPMPGWVDNLNGVIGFSVGLAKGVIRTMYGRGECFMDLIPADVTINKFICATYDYLSQGERRIFNTTASGDYKVSFQEMVNLNLDVFTNKIPFNVVFWYPNFAFTKYRFIHLINFYMFQYLPALILDPLLYILGYKPLLLKLQKKIWEGYQILEYYANRQWSFDNTNDKTARDLLNPEERKIFKLDLEGSSANEFAMIYGKGIRRFIFNELEDGIPAAQLRLKLIWFVDRLIKMTLILILVTKIERFFNKRRK